MNWHNEVFKEMGWMEGHQVDSNCCIKCNRTDDKIKKYEAKNYSKGCRICGTLTGEHGFSFDLPKAK